MDTSTTEISHTASQEQGVRARTLYLYDERNLILYALKLPKSARFSGGHTRLETKRINVYKSVTLSLLIAFLASHPGQRIQ